MASKKSVSLSVGRGEKKPTSQGAGLTAKGREKYNQALGATTNVSFTLNNSFISANDILILTVSGGNATAATYNCFVNSLAAGTASITLRNISAGSLSEAIVVNFALIHCV